MTDRIVSVPLATRELPEDVKVPAARISDSTESGRALLTGADAAAQRESLGLGTAAVTDADEYATAAQGAKADATEVEQVTLTAPLVYTLPTGLPSGVVHRVTFTQDATGGHTVTYDALPVTVALTAGASTTVELHPAGSGYVVRYPVAPTTAGLAIINSSTATEQRAALGLGAAATTDASGVSAIQPTLAKIKRGVEDVKLLVLGDSTGDSTVEWVYLLAGRLGTDWPTHTIGYSKWDDTARSYPAATVITTGSGARKVTIYNGSIMGGHSWHFQGDRFAPMIRDVQPDLILVSLGHNEDTVTSFPDSLRGRTHALLEQTTQVVPHADIVWIAQNPSRIDTNQARRATVYQRIASERGYGFIDVHQHFLDAGTPAAWYADNVHPSAAGSLEWVNVVHAHFRHDPTAQPLSRHPSSFLDGSHNYLPGGEFADFVDTLPSGWTLHNATATKDATKYDSPKGYSIKVEAVSDAAQSAIKYTFALGGLFEAMVGQWVTVAARLFVPVGSPSGWGRVALSAGASGTTNEISHALAQGAWRWHVLPLYVAPASTYLQVIIYPNVSAGSLGRINIDRIIIARGTLPRDVLSA